MVAFLSVLCFLLKAVLAIPSSSPAPCAYHIRLHLFVVESKRVDVDGFIFGFEVEVEGGGNMEGSQWSGTKLKVKPRTRTRIRALCQTSVYRIP